MFKVALKINLHQSGTQASTSQANWPTSRAIPFSHAIQAALQQASCNDEALDLAGSFPYAVDAQLAEKSLGDVLAHIAAATEYLHGTIRNTVRHFGYEQLGTSPARGRNA
jgi:hypothetical protein